MKRFFSFVIVLAMLFTCLPVDAGGSTDLTAEESFVPIKVEGSRSGEIPHPHGRMFRFMLIGSDRSFLDLSKEKKEAEVAQLREMSLEELEEYVRSKVNALANSGTHPAHDRLCAIMSELAKADNDDYLMQQVITIIYTSAVESENVPISSEARIFEYPQNEVPSFLVYAYDNAFNNPYWDELSKINGVDARAVVERWFLEYFDRIYDIHINRPVCNYGGYWIKHLAGIAVTLNDPDRVRKVIELMDLSLLPSQFYGDGMWREGTVSYGQMLVGNLREATSVIKLYKDPDDYVDTKFGLKLNYTDITDRWLIMDKWRDEINELSVYPNGVLVTVNDTHYIRGIKVDRPIKAEYLKNTELNHFGLYSMKYGNTTDAQQINLKFPSLGEGLPYSAGHTHGDFLGLTFWAGGMELLPDAGYVFNTAANRYFHMNAYAHNCSWVYSPNAASYTTRGSRVIKNNTYAYDDGTRNSKQVQLLEAESKHMDLDEVDMKRRAVMMISVDENHSYTVDIQRLKGGTVHENFLRQVEEEDVEFTTSLALPEPQSGTLGKALSGIGKKGGIVMSESMLTYPQMLVTDDSFDFVWQGVTSGTSLHAYIKGNKNTTIAFSKFPTMRRANNVVANKDKYPGYHFYQRQDVTPEDITIYGGVYEGYRKDDEGKIKNVEWLPAPDKDDMTQLVRVELADAVDYIYISNDNIPREYNGITFSGDYAAIRLDKNEDKIIWQYLYGEGCIEKEGQKFIGEKEFMYQVLSARGEFDSEEIPHQLRVKGVLPNNVKGVWGHTIYGDGTGVAFEIKDVDQSVVTVNNTPGFKLSEAGATMTTFPAYVHPETGIIPDTQALMHNRKFRYDQEEYRRIIPGNVWFEVKIPAFKKY